MFDVWSKHPATDNRQGSSWEQKLSADTPHCGGFAHVRHKMACGRTERQSSWRVWAQRVNALRLDCWVLRSTLEA
ncbi:Uncharacterised protein [Mycobacteroides abscessus]|nr:Uncharacterised protein [Mycobacteroides abscessus]SHT86413.1 Uncharacterised protein [Mycobacteroides abscessus subsp. abscessus]SIF04831.1 Uncharacterised protein [Mycobacteroides abscessus subsp. abscessus]SIM59838.1 Uncharacterised protein [Mycobacteroides abscessus subsp. abscessus]SKS87534.1 Uncharacterised protein [Mycobacteroides abscessus subsp. abscessus]